MAKPQHFRFGDRRIDIEQSVTEVNGKMVLGPPKNSKSRAVPLPKNLEEDLQQAIAGCDPDDPVFSAPHGGHIRLTTWRRRVFIPAVSALVERSKAAGATPFPRITPHDLRHTAASLAVKAGANVMVLQRMLGHSSAAITLNVYTDLYDADLDEVVRRMDALLRRDLGFE